MSSPRISRSLVVGRAQQVLAVEAHRAGDAGVAGAGQAHHGERGDRLAGAGLADDPERLAAVDGVGDAVDGPDEAVLGLEVDLQVLDLEERHQYRTRGSMNAYRMSTISDMRDDEERAEQHGALDHRQVRLADRVERVAADARDVEHGLGEDRAAEQDADVEAEQRDDRRDRRRARRGGRSPAARTGPWPARCGCSPPAACRSGCRARSARRSPRTPRRARTRA